jgi:hypothetical protein
VAKPAAVQIQWWFRVLVLLLIAVDLAALAGSVLISRSVRVVAAEAEPLASATASIRHDILAAQRDLFRYLAEFSDDTSGALSHLTALTTHVKAARASASPEAGRELDVIEQSAERYRKVLELMPRTAEGSRDWSRLQEYSATAIELGNAVEDRATRLAAAAQAEIHRRSVAADRIATAATWVAVGVLVVSILAVLALRHWWKQFEDVILGF